MQLIYIMFILFGTSWVQAKSKCIIENLQLVHYTSKLPAIDFLESPLHLNILCRELDTEGIQRKIKNTEWLERTENPNFNIILTKQPESIKSRFQNELNTIKKIDSLIVRIQKTYQLVFISFSGFELSSIEEELEKANIKGRNLQRVLLLLGSLNQIKKNPNEFEASQITTYPNNPEFSRHWVRIQYHESEKIRSFDLDPTISGHYFQTLPQRYAGWDEEKLPDLRQECRQLQKCVVLTNKGSNK